MPLREMLSAASRTLGRRGASRGGVGAARGRLPALFALALVLACCLLPRVAHAATYVLDETPGQGGTWTAIAAGKQIAKVRYSQAEWEAIRRRLAGSAVDVGATGQDGTIVSGSTTEDMTAERQVVEKLRELDGTNQGGTANLESVDGDLVDEAVRIGSLPTKFALLEAVAAIPLGIEAFKVGWKIGSSIRELLGFGGTDTSERELENETQAWHRVCPEGTPACISVGSHITIGSDEGTALELTVPAGALEIFWHDEYRWSLRQEGEAAGIGVCANYFGGPWEPLPPSGSAPVYAAGDVTACYNNITKQYEYRGGGEAAFLMDGSLNRSKLGANPNAYITELPKENPYGHARETIEVAAPERLKASPTLPDIATEIEGKSTTPDISPETTTFLLRESSDLLGQEKEGEVPNPIFVEVPAPEPNELYSHYKGRLEAVGLTKSEDAPYIEEDTDPAGDEVVSVTPVPGTRVNRELVGSTKIVAHTDPEAEEIKKLAKVLAEKNPSAELTQEGLDAAAANCRQRIKDAKLVASLCEALPIFLSGSDVASATNHDLKALSPTGGTPAWVQLDYESKEAKKLKNEQEKWYEASGGCPGTKQAGQQCDEYPFYASAQGGPPPKLTGTPSLEYINEGDNMRQGGKYGNFIVICGLATAPPFLGIPIPPRLGIPTETRLCNSGK